MKIFNIETPRVRLDGGAMFGVVPKTMWSKQYKADENNMIELACRSLLIDDGKNIVLIDTGVGDKIDLNIMQHYYADAKYNLKKSIADAGYKLENITHVINTHYHFDHCGGNTSLDENGNVVPTFKNAKYYVSKKHFDSVCNPNRRERASFYPENYMPVKEAGQLILLEEEQKITDKVYVRFFDGHTAGLSVVFIERNDKTLVFTSDMIPGVAHFPMSWIAAYDIEPLKTLSEKQAFLNEAADKNFTMFFQHDENYECASVKHTERGVRLNKTLSLKEWLES
ncbi:MAG: MBL fold metallo-hydrolase [Bacteroidales bacterium]|nr:MBL fold metallo-hydrolase [Bacteroidales bacterium]